MAKINLNGAVVYEGPSLLDGAPIAVIVTGLKSASANAKTGGMVQSWIIRTDVSPSRALELGLDSGICGDCPHRYDYDDAGHPIRGTRTCYVRVPNAPRAVYECYKRGGYLRAEDWAIAVGRGRKRQVFNMEQWLRLCQTPVRFGSYGDPLAAPVSVWQHLASLATSRTGYTHQWRQPHASPYKGLVQASCDTLLDYVEASSHGWKTFRVLPVGTPTPAGAVHCAASEERGKKTTCAQCTLCDGATRDVAIWAHGANAGAFQLA